MLNLALLIFVVVFLTQVIAWVGKSVLQELVFGGYSRLFLSGTSSRQRQLRKQILEDKAELSRTSSQDEFAKWAKTKRRLDKGLQDLEKINSTLASSKTSFGVKFSSAIWVLTTGSQLILVWWYRKQPVFWLPQGWTPGIIAWILSFPSAPKGAVSSAAWAAVCKRVLISTEEIFRDLILTPTAHSIPVPPFPSKPAATIHTIEQDKLD